jgi:hypothetical protein
LDDAVPGVRIDPGTGQFLALDGQTKDGQRRWE